MNRPPKMAAPPIPTTRPIMRFRVLGDMPVDLLSLEEAAAEFEAAAAEVADA